MNNLADLKEQIQENIIAYIDSKAFLHAEQFKDDLCQIIVDRVTELQDNEDYPDGAITSGDKILLEMVRSRL